MADDRDRCPTCARLKKSGPGMVYPGNPTAAWKACSDKFHNSPPPVAPGNCLPACGQPASATFSHAAGCPNGPAQPQEAGGFEKALHAYRYHKHYSGGDIQMRANEDCGEGCSAFDTVLAAHRAEIEAARRNGYNDAAVTFSTGSTKAIERARQEGRRSMALETLAKLISFWTAQIGKSGRLDMREVYGWLESEAGEEAKHGAD